MLRLAFAIALASFAATACVMADEPPTVEDALKNLRPEHPRLLAHKDDFDRIRTLVGQDGVPKQWMEKLRQRSAKLLSEPAPDPAVPVDDMLAVSRRALHRIMDLAMAYRIDGDRRYADRAIREMEAVCAFPNWNPKHYLDTAEMMEAVAIGYDWLYDAMTPEQRATIRAGLVRNGLNAAMDGFTKKANWTRHRFNWNPVCNGGNVAAALAVADEEPELAADVLTRAIALVKLAMPNFGPDGGWAEGPGYWTYATMYTTFMMAELESELGTDLGLSDLPGVSKTGDFGIAVRSPNEMAFNFADADEEGFATSQMFWYARRFGNPLYERYAIDHAEDGDARDLIWYDPALAAKTPVDLPLDSFFTGINVMMMRSAWHDPNAVYIGFKGGDNKAGHSHLDLGGFVLDALGKRWANDLGADDYNLKGYFGRERFTYYRAATVGHNTITIDGANQDPKAVAKIVSFSSTPDEAFGVMDLGAAYGGSAAQAKRGIALLNRMHVMVQDEIETNTPSEIAWSMHTRAEITLDGGTATLTLDGTHLRAKIIEPVDATFVVESAERSKPENPNTGMRKLMVRLPERSGTTRLVVLFTPYRDTVAGYQPTIRPLAEWKGKDEGDPDSRES
jgi:hypothetical protein